MSILRLRHIAGWMLLLGILCQILILVLAETGHISPKVVPLPPPDLMALGFVLFLIWICGLLGSGVALVGDYQYSPWIDILALLAWVGLSLCWFGTVPLVLGRVHSFNSLLGGYTFNIVPIVQFMTLVVLNPHVEHHHLKSIPQT